MNDPYKDRDTPHRDKELLRELYCEQRLNVVEIGEEIGSAQSTVDRWVKKFGLERPTETPEYQKKDVLERLFYGQGLSRKEIADRFDTTDRTINRWLRRHDLQPETPAKRHGRVETVTHGYEQFEDYTGPGVDDRVYIHRLLALRDHSLEEVANNHVHHEIPVPWLNYPDNIELMDASEHARHHNLGKSGNA